MREVDEALARAYEARQTAEPPQLAREAAVGRVESGRDGPPSPHFAVEPGPSRPEARWPLREGDELGAFEWPETVLALERAHGERFEALADRLAAIREERRLKVLLFTSCHRAEGRTTLVLCLARALARRPGRTLVVDGDLTGPMLARSLGLRPRVGLEDVVESGFPAVEAIAESPDDNLAALPIRGPVARPREFLASPGWSCLLAKVRREFDLVLIDGSPLFTGLSAASLHRSVDAAILVHHRGLTGERALVRAGEVLQAGGVPLLGLAETFA